MKLRTFLAALLLALFSFSTLYIPALAEEGMWTFNNVPREEIKKKYGFEVTDEWLNKARLASVRFNNGGSGSFVSPEGLVLTNHHVSLDLLHKMSTPDRDLASVGFIAPNRDGELKGPSELQLMSLQKIEDVTAKVSEAVTPGMAAADAAALAHSDAIVLPGAAAPAQSIQDVVNRLGSRPRIGTSSIRRVAQLARLFPGATFLPVRGNLGTRLRKLDGGDYDALVLAAAGLRRLGRADRITAAVPTEICVPAPGQGIIAVEIRDDDNRVKQVMTHIDDPDAAVALRAERTVVTRLGGGCQMPIGAYASVDGEQLSLTAIVVSLDGTRAARAHADGPAANPESIGARAAERLLADGAGEILVEVERARAAVEGLQP